MPCLTIYPFLIYVIVVFTVWRKFFLNCSIMFLSVKYFTRHISDLTYTVNVQGNFRGTSREMRLLGDLVFTTWKQNTVYFSIIIKKNVFPLYLCHRSGEDINSTYPYTFSFQLEKCDAPHELWMENRWI